MTVSHMPATLAKPSHCSFSFWTQYGLLSDLVLNEREIEGETEREIETHTHTDRKTNKERRGTETEREKHRDRERQRHTKRERREYEFCKAHLSRVGSFPFCPPLPLQIHTLQPLQRTTPLPAPAGKHPHPHPSQRFPLNDPELIVML